MAAAVWTLGESTIRQGDVEFRIEQLPWFSSSTWICSWSIGTYLPDHFQQVFLQLGQIIRLCALATFVGNDDLQSFFRDGSAVLRFPTAKEV